MMPNMLPKVGAGKAPNVFYNTGHGHLGWTVSAATAVSVAKTVVAARNALVRQPKLSQTLKELA